MFWRRCIMLGMAAIMMIIPWFLDSYFRLLLTNALIFGLFAMSYDIILGYTGLISVCHATIFGMGGYGMAISVCKLGANVGISILIGMAFSTGVGMIVGFFSTRATSRGSLIIMTIIFSLIFSLIAYSWTSLTGGENGLLLPIYQLSLMPGFLAVSLIPGSLSLYYMVFIVLFISYIICKRITSSPLGMIFQAIKDNKDRAKAIGYNTDYYEIVSSAIAGFFAGTAGIFYAFMNGFVGLDSLDIILSIEVIIWSIVGGLGTLIGPIIGAGLMTIITDFLKKWTPNYLIPVGIIFIIVVIFFRRGIVNFIMRRSGSE